MNTEEKKRYLMGDMTAEELAALSDEDLDEVLEFYEAMQQRGTSSKQATSKKTVRNV